MAGFSKCDSLNKLSAPRPALNRTDHKPPGRSKFEPITLERGVTHDIEFEIWAGQSLQGQAALEDFVLQVVNEAGKISASVKLCGCSVSELQSLAQLDAASNTSDIALLKLRCSTHTC